jgi:O-antigen ligase
VAVPAQRVQLAVSEFSAIDSSHDSRFDSSVGARVYLWKRALEEIPDHLLMGVGREVRMASIQRWGEQANSSMVKSLGHLHNNYLEELFDQGLFGLGSFLAFLAGLLYMVMRLRKDQPMAAVGMAGILFMHSTSSLTNVNFAHNYYPTVLSVAVSVCLLLFMRTSGSDDPNLKS